jgi:hypothetical protein
LIAGAPLSAGTRTAGLVVALGYLLGLVPGPLVAAVGGLALITFGRALLVDRAGELRSGISLALIAGAVGVAALRWGTLQLGEVRGVQAVLGPTLMVEPSGAAAACWLAAGGAVLALGVWLSTVRGDGRIGLALWGLEGVAGALAIVSVFWGPALGTDVGPELGIWVLATVAALLPALGLALFLPRKRAGLTWLVLMVAAIAVAVGAALVAANT